MAAEIVLTLGIILLAHSVSAEWEDTKCSCPENINRGHFPSSFAFGAASAAYQVEGGWNEDGKGMSIWDYYTHTFPDRIACHPYGVTADVTVDSYHRWEEDAIAVRDLNLDAYRFSISWARILPKGKLSGGINEKGLQYYDNLINYLNLNGLDACVTIFHWDVPLALEEEYGGFRSRRIVDDYVDFSDVLFWRYGDRIRYWITFNEPLSFCNYAYSLGQMAPGRCSCWKNPKCVAGDSSKEPYIAAHNLLLAHAATVKMYREKYQAYQFGNIGITLVTNWYRPYNATLEDDVLATKRAMDFNLGWFLDPITYGDYPLNMRTLVDGRLPKFTAEQSEMLKGSFDFIGLNYYTTMYTLDAGEDFDPVWLSYNNDSRAYTTVRNCHDQQIGPQSGKSWLYVYPKGLHDLLLYIKDNYQNPPIYITENGLCDDDDQDLTIEQATNDTMRQNYIKDHLCCVYEAIEKDKVNVTGYIIWSLLDNYEWMASYTQRFGMIYVDYFANLTRIWKDSAYYVQEILVKDYVNSEQKTKKLHSAI